MVKQANIGIAISYDTENRYLLSGIQIELSPQRSTCVFTICKLLILKILLNKTFFTSTCKEVMVFIFNFSTSTQAAINDVATK
jgi:hypothetical protein